MGPVFRCLARIHNWHANTVGDLTLAQIDMYLGPEAEAERESASTGATGTTGNSRIDPNTGHTLVTVGSAEEAAALMA